MSCLRWAIDENQLVAFICQQLLIYQNLCSTPALKIEAWQEIEGYFFVKALRKSLVLIISISCQVRLQTPRYQLCKYHEKPRNTHTQKKASLLQEQAQRRFQPFAIFTDLNVPTFKSSRRHCRCLTILWSTLFLSWLIKTSKRRKTSLTYCPNWVGDLTTGASWR